MSYTANMSSFVEFTSTMDLTNVSGVCHSDASKLIFLELDGLCTQFNKQVCSSTLLTPACCNAFLTKYLNGNIVCWIFGI